MHGAARVVVCNERELLGQQELRAAFGVDGLCRSRLPDWDDLVAERSVQRIRHVHGQRNAKLRALRLLGGDWIVPDQLHRRRGLRARVRLRCRHLQEATGLGVRSRRRMRRWILLRRGVLRRTLRRHLRDLQSVRPAGIL